MNWKVQCRPVQNPEGEAMVAVAELHDSVQIKPGLTRDVTVHQYREEYRRSEGVLPGFAGRAKDSYEKALEREARRKKIAVEVEESQAALQETFHG